MIHLSPVRLCLCATLLFLSLLPSHSQPAARPATPPDQITGSIDSAQLRLLPNHHPLWANAANDLGPATADLTLTLVLQHSPQQEAALDQLLIDQKNPASPDFHHWLTPVEFGQRFGLSDNDLQSVRNWIESQGLTVRWVASGGDFIGFGGPAAIIGRAFGTTIHNYRVRGEERISVSSDPMIPAALAPVVKSVRGLYTIPDKPASSITAPQTATPDLTLTDGSHYVTPGDFQIIYDVLPQSSGASQSIGIVGRSRTDSADFTNFMQLTSAYFQLPTEVVPTAFGGVDPGPALTAPPAAGASIGEQLEATLDVTRAGSIASGATLLLVISKQTATVGGIDVDTQYLVQTTPVPAQVINISYGDCESDAGQSGVNFWDTLFQQAASEGITVFVSSGDSGASGCEISFAPPVATPPAISPNYICSSSYATCVGGTEFNDTANPGTYWRTPAASGSNLASANSYIPEGGWNEPTNSKGVTQVASSGGGVSSLIATPAWQTGQGVPSARTGRYTPDISFTASCHDAYFGCMAAGGGGCVVTNGSFSFVGLCGTSAASPSMAAVAALVDSKMGYPVGSINPEIYALAQNKPASFHDATPTTSGVATCDINTPSMCNNSTPSPTGLTGGQAGYALSTGFDLVTGWGSLDINTFLTNFTTALPAPTVTVTPSVTTLVAGQPMSFAVQVAGGSGEPTPTGAVTLSSLGYTAPATTLANGQATISVPADTLPGNTNPTGFTAQYIPDLAGSADYFRASATTTVNITLITPTLTPAFSPGATVTTAQDLTLTLTLNGGTGNPTPTGSVTLYAAQTSTQGYQATATISAGVATFTMPAGLLLPGTDTLNLNYIPDTSSSKWYAGANLMPTVTVTGGSKTSATVTTTLSPASPAASDPITVTVKVAGATTGPTPTGTVSASGQNGTYTASLVAGTAQINPLVPWLPVGSDSISVTYSGDANYNSSTTTINVTVGKANTNLIVSPNPASITSAQSLSVYVTVLGFEFFPTPTGNVTLTAGTYTSSPTPWCSCNGVTFTVPANALSVGTDTVTATYTGDSNFNPASGTGSVTVTAPPPPSFTVGGSNVTISTPGGTTGNTSTVTITPANGFTGGVTLSASVTTSPAGAQDPPTVSFGSTSPVSITGAAGTAVLTVSTTAASTGALEPSHQPGSRWLPLGETALAGILLFGFRARRRFRAILGCMLLLTAIASAVTACGGGGGSNNPPPVTNPGTTPGTYVVTINATAGTLSASTTVNVVVQ